MIFHVAQRNPARRTAVAMLILILGLSFLIFGIVWPRLEFQAGLTSTWNDFLRGLTFGIALALETFAVVLAVAASRARRS